MSRERERSEMEAASRRSIRPPPSAAEMMTSARLRSEAINTPVSDDDAVDPAAAALMSRVRLMMAVAGATTLVAIAAVLGVIGYRVFKSEGSVPAVEVTALLPKGARVVSISAADDRVIVGVDIDGAIEARTYDVKTLRPTGRLTFANEP